MWETVKEAIYIISAIVATIASLIQIVDSFKKK